MNLEYVKITSPLRVFMVNPLLPEAQMFAIKVFNGIVFGIDQLVNMTLLVYTDERKEALHWIRQLESTTPPCYNSLKITTDLPRVSDADVFIIFTYLKNPNVFRLEDDQTAQCFDTLYLLLKVAMHLEIPEKNIDQLEAHGKEEQVYLKKHGEIPLKRKPIFLCDGLVSMDIFHTFSTNVPFDSFFCPSAVPAIAISILGDHLSILCKDINRIHIFGANDEMFHIEFERPLFVKDIRPEHNANNLDDLQSKINSCEWDLVGSDRFKDLNLEYTSFNASWLHKEFVEKVKAYASSNLHGPLFKSARMTKVLKAIWLTRKNPTRIPNFRAVGVISDGSLGTIKGLPYILPLNFHGETWKVNTYFANSYEVKAAIMKYNSVVQEQHKKLIPYCKKFYQEHVIQQKFAGSKEQNSSGATSSSDVFVSISNSLGESQRSISFGVSQSLSIN